MSRLRWALLILVTIGLGVAYLGNMIRTSRSMPPIHDVATDLDDLPQFSRLPLRADNLARVPDGGRVELRGLSPEERWKALHRAAYGDLRSLQVAAAPAVALQAAEELARARGWRIAEGKGEPGTLEATATTPVFRFKDDVVVRVSPDPQQPGGSIVDMRSTSRIGVSDLGTNAKRVRRFLADLKERFG